MVVVSVLGEQAIVDDRSGQVLTSSSRAVALLAFLACHAGSPQSRQRIAGLFWPDSSDAQALTNLRRELHYLRRVLGDDASLLVMPRDLCWRDARTCRVDLRVFDTERKAALAGAAAGDDRAVVARGTAAIAEYNGDLLAGADDEWLLAPRADLQRQCVDLCDLVGAALVRGGDPAQASDIARRRIRLEPLEETGYRTLMRLQADLGDRAGAISTYHHCASVLERELGVPPDAATRQVFQQLVARARPAAEPAAAPAAVSGRPGPAAFPLIGRRAELGTLQQVWRDAVAGTPGIALVRGDPGVGKSRLVSELAAVARRQGAVVASTQCFGTAGRLALAPVADWLRNSAIQSAVAALDPAWRAEVDRLLPASGRADQGAGARAMADAWQRHRFFEGLARGLLAVGRVRPLLLVLDNLRWCDQETLALVTFCLGLAQGEKLLLAATARGDASGDDADLREWIIRMRASGMLTELSLSPLGTPGTAELAHAASGRPVADAEAELLHAATGGFPLYVIEAVRSSADPRGTALPAGDLAAVLRKRLEQASPAASEVAGLAGAAGTYVTLDLLTEASDLDADEVVAAVDELWRLRIIREFRDGYDFSHDLLRETAYAAVSPARRWLFHRRIAQGLELLHAGDTDAVAAQLADQYTRGGRPDRAVAYYQQAAEVAAAMFAHGEAVRLHKKALAIIEGLPAGRDRDGRELGVLEAMAAPLNAMHGYSSAELQRTLERSIRLAETLGRRESKVASMVALWASRFVQGRIADGYQIATSALRLIDPDSELSGPAHFAVGGSAVSLGRPVEALRHLTLTAKLASGAVSLSVGTRPDVHATAWSAHAHWLVGSGDDALAACEQAISLSRAIGHPYSLAVSMAYGAITHQLRNDTAGLITIAGELTQMCAQYDFAYYREWALILDGWSRRNETGIRLAQEGIANLRSAGSLTRMPYWLSLLADLYACCGRPGEARAILDAAIAAAHSRDDVWWLPEVMRMRAAHDDGPAAIARLRSAAGLAATHGSTELARRCEHDLACRGVRPDGRSVRPVT
jgi:DNA-binding SARP family transcriptional activator/tetratricopeptide (TPR) repeat protein